VYLCDACDGAVYCERKCVVSVMCCRACSCVLFAWCICVLHGCLSEEGTRARHRRKKG
jgi:hypothetical protein